MCNSLSFDKCTIVKPLPTSRYNVYITPNSVPFDNTNKSDSILDLFLLFEPLYSTAFAAS